MASTDRTFRLGMIVGVIGFASVAGFYAIFDILAARGALYTVDLLGKSIFRGLRDPSILGLPIELDTTAIILYTGLHLLISLAIGLIVTGLVEYSGRKPSHARAVLWTIIAGFVITIGIVGMLSGPIRPLLPWWSIVVANGLAVVLAGAYLLRRRPGVWSRLSSFGT